MKRNDFIRGISLASLGAVLPGSRVNAATDELAAKTTTCTIIPSDTDSPSPFDTATNSAILRQDIRETKTVVPLNLKLKITDAANGEPIQNAWVKIWHCNKDGYRRNSSAHTNPGKTFLRGVQITDANGEVEFITAFPGWYNKRVTHIHFRVYVNSRLVATSQLTFPERAKNIIYTSGPLNTTQGVDPEALVINNIFSEGYNLEMATLSPNISTGGYNSSLPIAINATGAGSAGLAQPDSKEQFQLQQNYPNPYTNETTIPFSLTQSSDVEMEIYDLSGRKVTSVRLDELPAGDHHFPLRLNSLGIAPGTYVYQLVVTNGNGIFRQCKVMTGVK